MKQLLCSSSLKDVLFHKSVLILYNTAEMVLYRGEEHLNTVKTFKGLMKWKKYILISIKASRRHSSNQTWLWLSSSYIAHIQLHFHQSYMETDRKWLPRSDSFMSKLRPLLSSPIKREGFDLNPSCTCTSLKCCFMRLLTVQTVLPSSAPRRAAGSASVRQTADMH